MAEQARLSDINLRLVRTTQQPLASASANDIAPNESGVPPFAPPANDEPFDIGSLAFQQAPRTRPRPSEWDAAGDALPIFLSNQDDGLSGPTKRFGRRRKKSWISANKAGVIAAAAAGTALVALAVEGFWSFAPVALAPQPDPAVNVADARQRALELAARAAAPSTPHAAPQSTPQAVVTPATVMQTSQPATAPDLASRSVPSREDIIVAYRSAAQGQQQAPATAAAAPVAFPPPIAPPIRRIGKEELTALLDRARRLIAVSDIASARLLLQRAADAQEADAAFILAGTYDPAVLGRNSSVAPDLALARKWYEQALSLGSRDARRRLDQLARN
jgi:hypothetical protein